MAAKKEDSSAGQNDDATLKGFLMRHPVLTFATMGCCFLAMGIVSLNIVYLFNANFEFISEYGVMGLRDGGFMQFIGLVGSGFIALAFYVLFKICEKALVEWGAEFKTRKRVKAKDSVV